MSSYDAGREWRRNYEHLHDVLVRAQHQRDALRGFIEGEPEWVIYEHEVMHDTTNRLRANAGLAPLGADPIRRAEQLACGHFDYTSKFALACADLTIVDHDPRRQPQPDRETEESHA